VTALSINGHSLSLVSVVAVFLGLAALATLLHGDWRLTSEGAVLSSLVLVWSLITMHLSESTAEAAQGIVSLVVGLTLALICSSFPWRRQELAVAVLVVQGSALIVALVLLLQSHSGLSARTTLAIVGTGDPNEVAGSLVPALAVTAVQVITLPKRKALAAGACLLVLSMAIMSTGSRGSMFGAAMAVLAGVAMGVRGRGRQGAKRILALCVWLAAGFVAIAATPLWTATRERWAIAATSGGAGRIDIWLAALAGLGNRWFMGTGIGNFVQVFEVGRTLAGIASVGAARAPHSLWIQLLVEQGLVGLVLTSILWWYYLRGGFQRKRGKDHAVGFSAAALGLLVVGTFLGIAARKWFWLTLGFSGAEQHQKEET
jgi:hypothetical protein